MVRSIYFLISLLLCTLNSLAQEEALPKIKQGLGGETAIEDARFLMFSCKPLKQSETAGLHHYFIDWENGDIRFEGETKSNQSIVALFNSKTEIGEVYINNEKEDNSNALSTVIQYFKEDSYWILTPILIGSNDIRITTKRTEIIDSERYLVLDFEHSNSEFAKNTLFVNALTGLILRWQTSDDQGQVKQDFICSNHKDIGGGLILPTKFADHQKNEVIQYPIIAALLNIEALKFKTP